MKVKALVHIPHAFGQTLVVGNTKIDRSKLWDCDLQSAPTHILAGLPRLSDVYISANVELTCYKWGSKVVAVIRIRQRHGSVIAISDPCTYQGQALEQCASVLVSTGYDSLSQAGDIGLLVGKAYFPRKKLLVIK